MTEEDIEDPDKLNPWLREKLEEEETREATRDRQMNFILEIDPDKLTEVREEVQPMVQRLAKEINIPETPLMFVPVFLSRGALSQLTEIDGVNEIHYDMPMQIFAPEIPAPFEVISFERPEIRDRLLGNIEMNPISRPRYQPHNLLPLAAMQMGLPTEPFVQASSHLSQFSPLLPSVHSPAIDKIVPTETVAEKMGVPPDNKVTDTKIGILDTGAIDKNHRQWMKESHHQSFTGEHPLDAQGHGAHVATTACGGIAETRFGRCKGMAGVEGEITYQGKVLSNLGFGMTEWILRGMGWMIEQGVDVVNMSLGGLQQGPVENDPQVKVIEQTADRVNWIIAAGNSGTDRWTIGSPGVAPSALTVAAFSTVTGDVADFSSRGWSGEYYQAHPDKFEEDLESIGENLRKPDLGGYGGGPTGDNEHDEIYSATQGTSDGSGDLLVDGYCAMRGTSMASPAVAGLITLALERGLIDGVQDVKDKMAARVEEKDEARGYGLLTWKDLK